MKEYVLLFRMDITTPEAQPSAKQMERYIVDWMDWINYIGDKGQLADGGNHLSLSGKTIRAFNVIVDEPYTQKKETVTGYIVIRAWDMDDAVRIAKKCPILDGEGTSVEVRETSTPWAMQNGKKKT